MVPGWRDWRSCRPFRDRIEQRDAGRAGERIGCYRCLRGFPFRGALTLTVMLALLFVVLGAARIAGATR